MWVHTWRHIACRDGPQCLGNGEVDVGGVSKDGKISKTGIEKRINRKVYIYIYIYIYNIHLQIYIYTHLSIISCTYNYVGMCVQIIK
jgi:hypothetical protein